MIDTCKYGHINIVKYLYSMNVNISLDAYAWAKERNHYENH